jgi:hypothetical protein
MIEPHKASEIEIEAALTSKAIDNAAIAKAKSVFNVDDSWKPYLYSSEVGGGLLIKGCKTRPKKSGVNKGEPLYLTKEDSHSVMVTSEEIEYEKERLKLNPILDES